MQEKFILPTGLIGRFAVVKLWPDIKAAEDECIARLKIAATALGLECIEIHADGRLLNSPTSMITKKDVDFVLHLHYDTPKLYDVFSFVALWNPIQFYHDWGYTRCSRNLLTHDDFLSCSSPAADDHVGRVIRKVSTHLPPFFNLYHSVADIVYPPSLGDQKLFYAGINWEALGGQKKSRHGELLKRLDQTGELRIYGPTLFLGVKVWDGYNSYVREIPFDGVSMIEEIAKTGIALVLSSPAHKESELMSSRLFESVAAGALVICDENNFAKKFFGDSLLYIDTRHSVDKICDDILAHLAWAKTNVDAALKMIARAQEIFKQKFTIKQNLKDLYLGFPERKHKLQERQRPKDREKTNVCLYLLLPEYSEEILNQHIASVVAQEYKYFSAVMVIDKVTASKHRALIEAALAKSPIAINVLELDFQRRFGQVLTEVLAQTSQTDAVVFVAPNEQIFSNHLQVLADNLARNPNTNCAATAVILRHEQQPADEPTKSVYDQIDFRHLNPATPNGYARFIFRVSAFPDDLDLALPHLDRKSLAILVGNNVICQEIPATVTINIADQFPSGSWNEGLENAIIGDIFPTAFTVYTGCQTILPPLPPPSATVPTINIFRLILQLLRCWMELQIRMLRRDGLVARLRAVKQKVRRALGRLKLAMKIKLKKKLDALRVVP